MTPFAMNNRNTSLKIILGISFFLLFLLLASCKTSTPIVIPEPSPTVTQSLEPSPTIDWFPRTPTPTKEIITPAVTSQPENLPPGISSELFSDDFSDTTLWTTTKSQSGNVVYGNQTLSLAVAGNKNTLTSVSKHTLPLNFYLTIQINVALCSTGDQYGISFWRQEDGSSHRLLMTCEGSLRLERLTTSSGQVLKDWEVGSHFMPGSPSTHQVGIWASGGEIRVFVNETFQISATTFKDLSGGLSVIARAGGEKAETIVFSDLKVFKVEP